MDTIRLPEVPEETLRSALRYLYTGQLSFFTPMGPAADGFEAAQHLLHLSSLWGLDHLKRLVEDAMLRDLGGNVPAPLAAPMLAVADAHFAQKLRLYALHAAVRNWAAVRDSGEFVALPEHLRKEAEWYARSLVL